MTPDELKAAAEVVRWWNATNGDRILGSPSAPLLKPRDVWRAEELLAAAYLAEHPIGGDEPVTDDWLQAEGWECDGTVRCYWTLPVAARQGVAVAVFTGGGREPVLRLLGESVVRPATAGRVRAMLVGLGVA